MPFSKIQPGFLKAGDKVSIISPSFCIDKQKIYDAADYLEKWGLKVVTGKNAMNRMGPFAGTDDERLADIQEATDNPDIKAVFCSRGGYGLLRIIDRIDFSALSRSPKWYVGFSDITVLHLWLNEMESVVSLHADMPLHYNDPAKNRKNFTTLKNALFGVEYSIEWNGLFHREAEATGEITGGNLSVLISTMGTPAEPETTGKILFLEDTGEYIYHLDRMLTTLKLAGKLKDLSALVLGGFDNIIDTKVPWGRSLEEMILDIVKEYNYPVFFNFPAGHVDDNRAFYIGRRAVIKTHKKKVCLSFL
ncbi:MAG TPA: LD-carboxypeptidase [Bacteroidales bacterium]|nr:LD-carboxypeptidase [Bacteroidales bacterium]